MPHSKCFGKVRCYIIIRELYKWMLLTVEEKIIQVLKLEVGIIGLQWMGRLFKRLVGCSSKSEVNGMRFSVTGRTHTFPFDAKTPRIGGCDHPEPVRTAEDVVHRGRVGFHEYREEVGLSDEDVEAVGFHYYSR